jgi:hypothetical protein
MKSHKYILGPHWIQIFFKCNFSFIYNLRKGYTIDLYIYLNPHEST